MKVEVFALFKFRLPFLHPLSLPYSRSPSVAVLWFISFTLLPSQDPKEFGGRMHVKKLVFFKEIDLTLVGQLLAQMMETTGQMDRMSHRKWKETKQQRI